MKYIFLLLLVIPVSCFAKVNQDSVNHVLLEKISILETNVSIIDSLKQELKQANTDYAFQLKINEQTLNSISHQIGATSLNITIFGILFAIVALGLGVYITFIERKTFVIREETRGLLQQTVQTKEDVVKINELIQKDIYGLFLKIKREETVHVLNRLLKVPEDISNLATVLLSRELEKEDFYILKKAFLDVRPENKLEPGHIRLRMKYKDSYRLLFFQHFLDLSIADDNIGPELIEFYPKAIACAFQNDIIKSTEDFIKAIVDKGFQHCKREISSFIKGLSQSDYKDFDKVYEIIFNGLKDRYDRFKFLGLIDDIKETRIGKAKFGQLLKANYYDQNPTVSEKDSFDLIMKVTTELEEEERKRKEAELERKKKQEEAKKAKEEKDNSAQQAV